MRLILFQPDIPQNTGAMLRLAACFGLTVDLIEPCGFIWDDRRLRRSGMDYLQDVDLVRHASWDAYLGFRREHAAGRLILLTTRAATPHHRIDYRPDDSLMVGRESSGVPDPVHDCCDQTVRIPVRPGMRSLNVAISAAIVAGEALRQIGYPTS